MSVSTAFTVPFTRLNGTMAGSSMGRMTSTLPYQNSTPMVRFAAMAPTVAASTLATRPITPCLKVRLRR